MTSEQPLNHCSELRCPANNEGACTISGCLLIDPFSAVREINHKREQRGMGPLPDDYAAHFVHSQPLELRTTESFPKHPELQRR